LKIQPMMIGSVALIAAMKSVRTKMKATDFLCAVAKTIARAIRPAGFGSAKYPASLKGNVDACATPLSRELRLARAQ
jgi:hypothetical protein